MKREIKLSAAYIDERDRQYEQMMRRELPGCSKTKRGYKAVSVTVAK